MTILLYLHILSNMSDDLLMYRPDIQIARNVLNEDKPKNNAINIVVLSGIPGIYNIEFTISNVYLMYI